MAISELRNGDVDKAFHPHHGHGGGRECERDPFPELEALFL